MSVVGFDIGNETCFIGIARSGGIEVIDNEYSSRMTPSYVGFTEKSRVVGVSAKSKLTANINNTVFGFKTLLGKKFSNALNDFKHLSFDVCELPSDEIGIAVKYLKEDAVFTVQQVMAMMLTKLKTLAEVKLGSTVRECVISVPVFYTDNQRRSMLDAAEISGLKILKLMNEPTAIALQYGFYKQNVFDQPRTIVFVDMGQSALTATAAVFTRDKLTILGCVWNRNVGGRDFDLVLVRHFAEEFKSKYDIDIMTNKKAVMTLMLECEALKKQMSMNSRTLHLNIECFMNDIDVSAKMNRELFEKLSSNILTEIENCLGKLLIEAKLDKTDVDEIQVVGGSCRLPALKNIIFKVFGQNPQATLNQDEAVARGCALQCAFLSPTLRTKDYVIEDIQAHAIKVSTIQNNVCSNDIEVFPRFHKVPASRKVTYEFKNHFHLKVYYGDPSLGVEEIGKFHFSGVPGGISAGSDASLKVILSIDINGVFNVTSAALEVKESQKIQNVVSKETGIVPFDENAMQSSQEEQADETDDPNDQKDMIVEEKTTENIAEIKSYILNIQADVSSLPKHDLNQLAIKEQQMINTDLREKKIADLRNVVEEYIYESREKLSEDLQNFVTSDVKDVICALLNETEEWLYDTDSQSEHEYLKKLNELRTHFEPVSERYHQFHEIKFVLDEFKNLLGSSLAKIRIMKLEKKRFIVNESDIKNLEVLWNQKNECFNRFYQIVNEIDLRSQEIPISAEAVREEMYDFQNKMNNIVNKPALKVIHEEDPLVDGAPKDSSSIPNEKND